MSVCIFKLKIIAVIVEQSLFKKVTQNMKPVKKGEW